MINDYLKLDKVIIRLRRKIPIDKNWINIKQTPEELYKHDGNFGWRLGHNDLVIDVDFKRNGKESFERFYNHIKTLDETILLLPTVNTPNGQHYYLSMSSNVKIRKNLPEYPGIDFLSYGCQCVIAGSVIDNVEYVFSNGTFSQASASNVILSTIENKNQSNINDMPILASGFEKDAILEMLSNITDCNDYDNWVKVGMGLHNWDSVHGLEIWDNWSKNSKKYKKTGCKNKWKTFDVNDGVTVGTLKYLSEQSKKLASEIYISELDKKIKDYKPNDDIKIIIKDIANTPMDDVDMQVYIKKTQNLYKIHKGVTISITDIKKQIKSMGPKDLKKLPKWCKDWIYVNSHNAYVNLNMMSFYKAEAFNLSCGINVPEYESGGKCNATKFVSDNNYIEIVNTIAYLPQYSEKIVTIDNSRILNIFDRNSVPIPDVKVTDDGLKAIELIKSHLKLLCNTDEYTEILIQWLAHNIQYPGKKIMWSPIIQSIQGVGKTFIGNLLRGCLGDKNVGTVSSTQVTSNFNGWATGYAVNIMEELRIVGHNRYDITNSLKPLITDSKIQINDKHTKQYNAMNTCNYICFTNYKDAIPIENEDRRWWVIYSGVTDIKQIDEKVGMPRGDYYPILYNLLVDQIGQIRKWLLEYPISQEFMRTKTAPDTVYKRSMVATENASRNNSDMILELLTNSNNKLCNLDLILVSTFKTLVLDKELFTLSNLSNNGRAKDFKDLGYTSIAKFYFKGEYRYFWTKIVDKYTEDQLKVILEHELNKNLTEVKSVL